MVADYNHRRRPPLVGVRLAPDWRDSYAGEEKPRARGLPRALRLVLVAILLAGGFRIALTAKDLDSGDRIVAASAATLVMLSLVDDGRGGEPYAAQALSAVVSVDFDARLRQTIARIHGQVKTSTDDLEATIAMTGLDAGALLDNTQLSSNGQGGGFVGLDGLGPDPDAFAGVSELESNLQRLTGLRNVLRNLPLVSPVDSYYVSSRFGKRRDPLTRRWAMHNGIDLSGNLKSPVRSTASGVVTSAGYVGGHGKSVEISHGNGVTTRYSHLHKILVAKGQDVPFRHKIGLMGSTGRSTGSHVHYEIRFRGVPQDPAKFLKAGRYAFKVGPASVAAAAGAGVADKASDGAPFRVHLASYRLSTSAEAGWREIRKGREDLFNGLKPTTELFDAGADGGIYYRLLVGPLATLDAARGLCAKLRRRNPDAWCDPVEVAAK